MIKKQRASFALVALASLGMACSFSFGGGSESNTSETNGSGNSSSVGSRPEAKAKIPEVTTKKIDETVANKKVAVSAEYPQISGVEFAGEFNSLVEGLVKKSIDRFKSEIGDPEPDDRDRTIDIGFQKALVDSEIVSVIFYDSEDAGGAHPNTVSFVVNFDLKTGRELSLRDLFKSGAPYLEKISRTAVAQLRKQIEKEGFDAEWVQEGAGPKNDNYKSWVITSEGISVTFDAYQVAAYAFGPQEVLIPFSDLKDLLAENAPVSHLIR